MSDSPNLPVIILGGGGHARVLADALQNTGHPVLGYCSPEPRPPLASGIDWLGDDEIITRHDASQVRLINGIGSVGQTRLRRKLFEHWCGQGYGFASVRHASNITAALDVELGQGCLLLAGSLLGPGVMLGDNVLINSRAVVEHDCQIGAHSHVATGAILCGGCSIGSDVHIGAGAVVIQGISVGSGAIIAAGSVVTKNVDPLTLIAGVPGQPKRALNE